MTRINVGVMPCELPDKLLLAEHRELTRIPNAVKSGRAKIVDIPPTFRLGPGHVKFFYNKLNYLRKRYLALYDECMIRNFNVTDKYECFHDINREYFNDYTPTSIDRQLIINRIRERGFELIKYNY